VDDRVLLLSASTGDVAFQDKSSLSRGSHLHTCSLSGPDFLMLQHAVDAENRIPCEGEAKYIKKEREKKN
jgi:hypothetical protein